MAESFEVEVIETGDRLTIADPEPIESAKLFWKVSDTIWDQKPVRDEWAYHGLAAKVRPIEALDLVNDLLNNIEPTMIIAATHKVLMLSNLRGERPMSVDSQFFASPKKVTVGTFNWDDKARTRSIYLDRKRTSVKLLDGNRDKDRELGVVFHYQDEELNRLQLKYSMQRHQTLQDRNIPLSMTIWRDGLAESSFGRGLLESVEITQDQEIALLQTLQTIGGLSIKAAS